MRRYSFILILLIQFFECKSAIYKFEHNSTKVMVKFDTLLNAVDNEINHSFDAAVQLFASKSFRYLFDSSFYYLLDIEKALGDSNIGYIKKLICIYAVQKIDLNLYIGFTQFCVDSYQKNLISEQLLDRVFFPAGFKTDMRFAENYKNIEVKKIFDNVLKLKHLSKEFRKRVKYAKSGKMLKERERMRKSGYED